MKDFLVDDDILSFAVTALDDVGLPSKAVSVECLRDVLTENPDISRTLQQKMAEQLRKAPA